MITLVAPLAEVAGFKEATEETDTITDITMTDTMTRLAEQERDEGELGQGERGDSGREWPLED